jgi:transposase
MVDFGFQRGGEHPAGALADDLVDQGAGLGGAVFGDYAEHGRAFPTRAAMRAYSMTVKGPSGRYALCVPPADPQVLSIARLRRQKYKERNAVERCITRLKQWRGLAMRTDKLAVAYRAASPRCHSDLDPQVTVRGVSRPT